MKKADYNAVVSVPNFIICGAPKSGTSSLFRWIADHPDALGSSEKETYVCVDPGSHMYDEKLHISRGVKSYSAFFPSVERTAGKSVILESTPGYMYYRTALNSIPFLSSSPKCLFVLREPGNQIYSLFNYFKNNWSWIDNKMTFEQYLAALRSGVERDVFKGNELASNALENARYVDHLRRWKAALGEERMKVCDFDDLKNDHVTFTKSIAQWLGLDPTFYDDYPFPRDNETYAVKISWLQKFNVFIRAVIPRGLTYDFIRVLYRKINTSPPVGPSDHEKIIISGLSKSFKDANDELRKEFGLKLPGWS